MQDLLGTEREYLMNVFDLTIAMDDATKDRIRHRVLARIEEIRHQPVGNPNVDAFLAVAGLGCGVLLSLGLAAFWSAGYAGWPRLGSVAIALLVFACVVLLISELLLGRLIRSVPALYLTGASVVVLAIRSLPLISVKVPIWVTIGLRSGLVASIIGLCILMLGLIYEPVFNWMSPRAGQSKQPEAFIIKRLLQIVSSLEELENMRSTKDQLILETLARYRRREELRGQAMQNRADGQSISELTDITQLKDGTFVESYTLEIVSGDGSTETLLNEENASATQYPFMEDPQWGIIRKELAHQVEDVALHIELSLPEKLSVGDKRLDLWLKQELQARAQTIRNWTQRVVLPSDASYENLLFEVGSTTVHAAEDQWSAIAKSEIVNEIGLRQRLLGFCRKAVVGVIPLAIVVAAPALRVTIPLAIRDSLLTFAVPWTLLQLIELINPDASDYLSRSKSIRELLPASYGGSSKA